MKGDIRQIVFHSQCKTCRFNQCGLLCSPYFGDSTTINKRCKLDLNGDGLCACSEHPSTVEVANNACQYYLKEIMWEE